MQALLQELEMIEKEHAAFFEPRKLKLFQYVLIGRRPVMLRFNKEADSIRRLPNEVYEKLEHLIMSYYYDMKR